MAIVNANDLKLYTSATGSGTFEELGHAQTASLSYSNSLIDVTTKVSNSWMQKISGQRSFSLSADGLLDFATVTGQDIVGAAGSISAFALAGSEIFFQFGIGDSRYEGSGFISSFEQSGGTDDAPTYSISIEGNGTLTYNADITS